MEVGKAYTIAFPDATANNISTGHGFLGQYASIKVLKLAGGPWVEVETSWQPQNRPTPITETLLLNLDHALLIRETSAGK